MGHVDTTYEDRTVFLDFGTQNPDAGEVPNSRNTTYFICPIKTLIKIVLNFPEYRFVTPTQFPLRVPVKHKLACCCKYLQLGREFSVIIDCPPPLLSSHHVGICGQRSLNVWFRVYGSDFLKNEINT